VTNGLQPGGLESQMMRLAGGLSRMPDKFIKRCRSFVQDAQRADGGFAGRRGVSDLYYAGFALRAADLLAVEDDAFWSHAAAFLHAAPLRDCIEVLLLLHGRMIVARHGASVGPLRSQLVREVLAAHAVPDGGFSTRSGGLVSVYHTFLAAQCYAMLGRTIPHTDAMPRIVLAHRCSGRGFADSPGGSGLLGGVNSTAAAVQVLRAYDALDDDVAEGVRAFVIGSQRRDGGFAAIPDAPMSDLLSTFTALLTLAMLDALDGVRLGAAARFVKRLARRSGGFGGAESDRQADLEYTYYGLATVGLLSAAAAIARQGERN
jgi:geranylgeranyl transferase type-2 subunit beta